MGWGLMKVHSETGKGRLTDKPGQVRGFTVSNFQGRGLYEVCGVPSLTGARASGRFNEVNSACEFSPLCHLAVSAETLRVRQGCGLVAKGLRPTGSVQ